MNRLKEIREDKDLTQTEVAKVLNMSQTGYSKYEVETNDIPPSFAMLIIVNYISALCIKGFYYVKKYLFLYCTI